MVAILWFAFRRTVSGRFRPGKRRPLRFVLQGHRERRSSSGATHAMRRSALILAGVVLAGTAAGDEMKPASRYAVQPSDDGFIRLDTQTGAVSHCGRRAGVWFCEKLVEDQTALEKRIDELAAQV